MSTSTSGYRDNANDFDLQARVEKLEKEIDHATSQWRVTFWEGWKYLGWLMMVLVVVVPLGGFAIRGCAIGVNARTNAEREAVRFVRQNYPTYTNLRAYCVEQGGENCQVTCTAPDQSLTLTSIRMHCDDDYPVTNSGCKLIGLGVPNSPVSIIPIQPPTNRR